jgi:NAD(P)-dependent dehydrogenase (short-subunit alcohol dehydrogenase family)
MARSKAELDLAHLEIEHQGGVSTRIRADVTDYEETAAAVNRFRGKFGGPDVVICAAAVQGNIGPFFCTSPKAWRHVIDTNLVGVAHVCRAAAPDMVERRSGKIIAMVCRGGSHARPNFSAYAASKAALVRFVESVGEELMDHNVQINCMSPGNAYTAMTDEVLRAGEHAGWREIEEAESVRRTGGTDPEQQIQLALFLASEQSNHITGKLIYVGDDWKKLRNANLTADAFTLRRVTK